MRFRRLCGLISLVACATMPSSRGERRRLYLHDAAFRRATLESSLVARDSTYARVRLRSYARDWDDLPAWNPNVKIDDGAPRPIAISSRAQSGDEEALRALGEEAFFRYPAQPAPYLARIENPAEFGLDRVVLAQVADGSFSPSLACASCHVRKHNDTIYIGAPNDRLDLGALLVASSPQKLDPAVEARFRAWGPGRVDVTTHDGREPLKMPDLRAVRFETHLHASGAVVQRDEIDLAIRIETLIVTAHDEALRPPREIALGLAVYLFSLADALPAMNVDPGFRARCGGCHRGRGLAGPPIGATIVGTDPAIARSSERGTDRYRVPSLRGVGTRGPLMHDAKIPSLDALFAHPEAGHPFGRDLDERQQTALLAFLRAL